MEQPNQNTSPAPSLHHSFDIRLATKYSMEEAILIHHFQHWIAINKRMGKNQIDGRTWTYQTQKYIAANFPYFKNRLKILRIIDGLVKKKVLIEGNFNKKKFDRTKWYAFADENAYLSQIEYDPSLKEPNNENEQSILPERTIECSEVNNGMFKVEPPIPDTKDIYLRKTQPLPSEEGESDCFLPKNSREHRTNLRALGTNPRVLGTNPRKLREIGKHVQLTEEEHAKLVAEHGEAIIAALIEEMNDYISSTGKKPYKDWAAALRNWLRRRKAEKPNTSSAAADEALANKIIAKYPNHPAISKGHNYLQIVLGPMNCIECKFGDAGFSEIVTNTLRKMGLIL